MDAWRYREDWPPPCFTRAAAALSGVTAASWMGMLQATPKRLHVSAPRRRRSLPEVRVHGRRSSSARHRTGACQLLLRREPCWTLRGRLGSTQLRRALAEAEYLKLVTLDEVAEYLGRGKPGSAALRVALDCHRPQLARTKSRLEEKLLLLCERYSLTPPDVNVWVAGWLVDAVWFDQKVIVELDSHLAHGTPARLEQRPPARPRSARRGLHRAALHLGAAHGHTGARDRRPAPRATSVTCRGRSRSRPCGPSPPDRTGAPCSRSPRPCRRCR